MRAATGVVILLRGHGAVEIIHPVWGAVLVEEAYLEAVDDPA